MTPTARPISTGTPRATATARPARAQVQPWTARIAEHEQGDRPGDEDELEHLEQPCAGAGVGAAAPEDVLAVESEPERPEDEREGDRRRGERDQVPRPPVAPL